MNTFRGHRVPRLVYVGHGSWVMGILFFASRDEVRSTWLVFLPGDSHQLGFTLPNTVDPISTRGCSRARRISMTCEDCKVTEKTQESTRVETICKEPYPLVDACMIRHGGNVSSCKDEWKAFRACYNKVKGTQSEQSL